MEKIRDFLIDILETHHTRTGKIFGNILVGVIVLSIIAFMVDTIQPKPPLSDWMLFLEKIIFAIFGLEYILRFFISRHKTRFVFSFLSLIDLLVLVSFYGHFWNLAALRGLRIFRVFQLLKITGQSKLIISFMRAFRYYKDEMHIFALTLFMVLFLSSTGFYYFELAVNPRINNIFDSFWWSIVTIFTWWDTEIPYRLPLEEKFSPPLLCLWAWPPLRS